MCCALLMAGCAGLDRAESPAPVPGEPGHTDVDKPVTPTPPPPATSAFRPLLDKAEQASTEGDYPRALALLERALRIDPDSAEIYLNLAKTYRAKGDREMARASAERGLLYCRTRAQCKAIRAYVR